MSASMIVCLAAAAVWVSFVMGAYTLYKTAFSVPKKRPEDAFSLPSGGQYAPYTSKSREMMNRALAIPHEDVWIASHDGLKLYGRYYHTSAGAPVQIMMHGYRSAAERDFCGGLPHALDMGQNVLLVDQRAHGKSEGKCLTFGILERFDCLRWAEYACARFGENTPIYLSGMSMGAATVLMAAALPLPKNVAGIVADCGYTAPEAILRKVIRDKGYPDRIVYPLVRLGGKLFGGFDPSSASAARAMEHCAIPVLFIHGADDRFVPCDMSRENYRLCAAPKRLFIVPEAGHGLSYFLNERGYLLAVSDFFRDCQKDAKLPRAK